MMNIAIVYQIMKDFGEAEELYERALEGKEGQLGKDHESTIRCARNIKLCLEASGNDERLAQLLAAYPKLKTN
ncbi:hypothetical protein TrLO_g9984 [Triparma laevis f. longispina]|uniref:Kinesin light chain n=1 Tax=Triparma laevis f. longispina TaxID=1714387 RepID=A0A9W7ARD1_9STRA|nr:hypothetical protein TrLO_g9984 [Triparma laevis f. longispina]